jgi:hypothetical protein
VTIKKDIREILEISTKDTVESDTRRKRMPAKEREALSPG